MYPVRLSHCQFTIGAKRAVVADLQKEVFMIIPKDLAEMVNQFNSYTMEEIYAHYGKENSNTLDEYFLFLRKHEYVFFTEHKADTDRFININPYDWKNEIINNGIIDISEESRFSLPACIAEMTALGCKYLQLRFYRQVSNEELKDLFACFTESEILDAELYIPFNSATGEIDFNRLFLLNQRVSRIIIYNSPEDKTIPYHYELFRIYFVKEQFQGPTSCGVVHLSYFSANLKLFTEGKQFNTCLYKKISIAADGSIRNCPGMPDSFGNINVTSLKEALNIPGFKKHWQITKNQISVCKDCEFRDVCTDCRAYLQSPDDIYSKPLKCGYDPYTCKWEDWSTNLLSKKTINHYGMKELIKPNQS